LKQVEAAIDMAPEKDRSSDFVEALAKGIAILESFDAAHPEMTLSEVARRVGLSPAAARRSLITLTALGYIGQTQKRFHLKPKIMSLGSALYFSARIDELMQPELREIVDKFGDASSVATMEGDMVIYIAHVSVQRARRAAAVVGARYPAYATSLGRVMLAGLPENRLNDYFESVKPVALTSRTLIDKEALRAEIRLVREQGFSTTVDQLDYGITAISVPIRDIAGNTVAALNSSGYTGMVTPESLGAQRLQELHAAASRIALSIARYPILGSIIGT
tara:strand:+ start:10127 stop:10957 length:831 start_codon:yes stop_codon:yes gene_type:complete